MQKSQMTWYTLPRPIHGVFDRDDEGRCAYTVVIAFAFDGETLVWLTHHGNTLRDFLAEKFVE